MRFTKIVLLKKLMCNYSDNYNVRIQITESPPIVTKRKRKPSLEDSYSDISSVSSSSESDVSAEEDIPSQPSPTVPTTSKIVETESDEESDDDSDIYEQLRNTRKLSVNSVYSDKESSEEEEEGVEENLSQEEVEPSPSLPVAMHIDHMYAKPPKTPEAQSDTDNVVVEINEEDEKLKKEELLTAQARQHTFPARSSEEEDKLLNQFRHGYGPDKEEVEMFKLALKRLKGEKDDLVSDVPWAYYPSDILCVLYLFNCACHCMARVAFAVGLDTTDHWSLNVSEYAQAHTQIKCRVIYANSM